VGERVVIAWRRRERERVFQQLLHEAHATERREAEAAMQRDLSAVGTQQVDRTLSREEL
jgi:NAD(P)-dependent dehydrogenase (short-subunit alcohol dehydrogenase family)